MSLTIDDLQPKEIKVKIGDLEMTSKPLRLSHTLILTQLGEIFQNPKNSTFEEIKNAENNVDSILSDLIPELAGKKLDAGTTIDIISQLINTVQPSDNAELNAKGVKFDSDPKAGTIG